jgi:hypothetical protein
MKSSIIITSLFAIATAAPTPFGSTLEKREDTDAFHGGWGGNQFVGGWGGNQFGRGWGGNQFVGGWGGNRFNRFGGGGWGYQQESELEKK